MPPPLSELVSVLHSDLSSKHQLFGSIAQQILSKQQRPDVTKPDLAHFVQNVEIGELRRAIRFIRRIAQREEVVHALVHYGWDMVLKYVCRCCAKILTAATGLQMLVIGIGAKGRETRQLHRELIKTRGQDYKQVFTDAY